MVRIDPSLLSTPKSYPACGKKLASLLHGGHGLACGHMVQSWNVLASQPANRHKAHVVALGG